MTPTAALYGHERNVFLFKFDSPQVKQTLMFSILNFVFKLPKSSRLRKLGNEKNVETQARIHSSLKKLIFGNMGQNLCEGR